ncbi:MAG: zinc-binding alcohol dehydrogenase [Bacteroidota bacterium]
MNTETKLLWHSKSKSWFEKVTLETPKVGWVKVKSLCSFISQGTERLVIAEDLTSEIAKAMAVPYLKGSLGKEFTYGYSLIGEIVEGENHLLGKKVHIMHPHQDIFNAKIEDLSEIPGDMSPEIASLASNMETAINAIWDAEIELGDRVLIMGYGVIGALIAEILQSSVGVEVRVIEKNENRAKIAKDRGLEVLGEIRHDFDAIFNTTSSETMLQQALEWTSSEGKVLELSWYGSKTIQLHLGADFHYGRKKIISSQVSHIPGRKQPRWSYTKRKQLVFKLLSRLNFDHLTQNKILFQDSAVFYDQLRKGKENSLSTVIIY